MIIMSLSLEITVGQYKIGVVRDQPTGHHNKWAKNLPLMIQIVP